jgi:endonuclease IV
MPDDQKAKQGGEDIEQFTEGTKSFRDHLNEVVDGTNGNRKRIEALEKGEKKYEPMILVLCDSGDLAEYEVLGLRLGDATENEDSAE